MITEELAIKRAKLAKEAGIDAAETKFPFAANGRAIALNETDGFVHYDKRS